MAQISNIQLPSGTGYGIRAGAIPFGEVDSTSTSTAFTATVPGITELTDGTTVMLRNGQVTSASGFTLNVNELGAKPCYNNLATGNEITPTAPTRDTTIFNINYTMLFVYQSDLVDGGAWICYRGYDGNTNTIGYQLRTNSGNLPAIEAGYRYRIWFTSLDGLHWVPINTSTSTNATTSRSLNTRVIDPFGPIVYNSTNGTVAKDARPPVTTLWQQYTLTIGYSYVKTLTAWKPVYLKCTPQSGGGVVMNDIVQALPTSADGKIYIYLGQAYSATAMELRVEHPVYYHDGTGIRLWSGAAAAESDPAFESVTADDGNTVYASDTTALAISGLAGIETVVSNNGTIGIGHTNYVTAQTTQAVYPIKIDTEGHISGYGNAVTIPTVPTATGNSTTGISIANHGTGTVIGVQSTTTTASKVTLGDPISVPNVTSAGSASTWTFEEKSIPNVTAAGSGSASLTMTMDTTDTKKLNIVFSHTHTAPTIGTAIKVQSKSGGSNGTAPTLGTAISIANVTDVDDVTVPIKNTSASTFVTGTTHTITDNGHTHSI